MSDGQFFPGWDEEEEYSDMVREQARLKARFCLATGIAPSEYDNLTVLEIQEFAKEHERQNKKSKG